MVFNRLIWLISISMLSIFGLKAQKAINTNFHAYEIIEQDGKDLLTQVYKSKTFPFKLKFQNHEIELIPSNFISEDYQGMTENGVVSKKSDLAIPFHGYTKKGGRVSLTLKDNFMYGFIEIENDRLYIEPLRYYDKSAEQAEIIVYKRSDIKKSAPKTCGVNETESSEISKEIKNKVVGQCYDVEYAVCSDWLMVNSYGSVAAVEDRNIGVVNNVITDYDDAFADQLNLVLTGQFTPSSSAADPWTNSTDINTVLPNFRTWAMGNLSIPHDVASLWSARDFNGSTIGLAYLNAVCNGNTKYNVLEDFDTDADLIRVLTTHELGHNFGSNHDAPGSPHIMAPSVQFTSSWSSSSVNQIENYYNSVSCLSACIPTGTIPTINFAESSSVVNEYSISGSAGPCNLNFIQLNIGVGLTNTPSSDITAQLSLDPSSTAMLGTDFEILNSTITFVSGQSLFQNFTINIYEDHVQEITENIILNLTVTGGTANNGSTMTHEITINDINDEVSNLCCSGGETIDYGSSSSTQYQASSVFYGLASDVRTRSIILASELSQAGLTAGSIDALALIVTNKSTNAPFQDFRIGLAHTSNSTISSMPWINTTQVFNNDVETVNGTNAFYFDNSFIWDGSSNLYIQFCFNNTSAIGNDELLHVDPLISNSTDMLEFLVNNNSNGCSMTSGSTFSYGIPIQPRILFYRSYGAIAETEIGASATSNLSVEDEAHLYSSDDEIIVSITNQGSSSIQCLEASIHTSGIGKLPAGFGNGNYSQKTYSISGDQPSIYDLTLYYTEQELNTWGSSVGNLNIVKSTVPLDQATESDVEIIPVSQLIDDAGGNPQKSFTASFSGFSYFGLTDIQPEVIKGNLENADLVIGTANTGILLKSPNGTKFRVYATNNNVLASAQLNGQTMACLPEGDLFIATPNKGLIMKKPGAGYLNIGATNTGAFDYNGISSLPQNKVILYEGDFEIQEIGKGVVIQSLNGTCWRLSVANGGSIDLTEMTNCP